MRASPRDMLQVKSQQRMLEDVKVIEFKRLPQQRPDSLIVKRSLALKFVGFLTRIRVQVVAGVRRVARTHGSGADSLHIGIV